MVIVFYLLCSFVKHFKNLLLFLDNSYHSMADEYIDILGVLGEEFLEQVDILGNFDEINALDSFF